MGWKLKVSSALMTGCVAAAMTVCLCPAASAENDQINAQVPGASMNGAMTWYSPDLIAWDVTVTDTARNGGCANLFWAGNWGPGRQNYLGHACGFGQKFRSTTNRQSIGSQGQGIVSFIVCQDRNNAPDNCARDTNRFGGR